MPFIRDYSQSYTTSTIGTTIVVPMPAYAAGDLLLAILTADTGTQTFTATGWTLYNALTSTSRLAVYYKISTASESDVTFTASAAETFNGAIISVGDVDTTSPFDGAWVTGTATGSRYDMPRKTTTVNNCLILYCGVKAAVAVPQVIEGNAHLIFGKDGSAHSDYASWGFQETAGQTPIVRFSTMSSQAGADAVFAIKPPAGGAQVIPAYTASDNSVYLTPFTGAAFNGDTATTNAVTTYFGTTLNGRPLAASGTTYTRADYGINSYHAMCAITGLTTSGTYAGNVTPFATANKPNISNKNVLFHAMPYLPVDIQTTDSVTLTGAMGVAVGFYSTANTHYKWWHVHGANTPYGTKLTPIVIHPDATAGVIQSTGTLDATSIAGIGCAVSGKNVAPDWVIGSCWALDTTVIAGGNASYPVKIPNIVSVAADAHERMSVIQQGASQMMALQPLQFGNGGINKLYLDLRATAIEFPKQYDKASRLVNYNSVDNFAGLTYYAGANDTIIHTSALVSSLSKFHWRIHASSSSSATYNFKGLGIVGAGDVQLRDVTVFEEMSFVDCPSIYQNSSTLSKSNFTNSYIYANSLADIVSCSFTSSGIGHAIEITAAGTYTFIGNKFTGYGANGTTNAAIYNNSGGVVVINISGGGSTPTIRNGGVSTTTVNNTINLTLTGLIAGSDIVILKAGTSTELMNVDAAPNTTHQYSYQILEPIDVCVYKKGYIPFAIRNYSLASSDASLLISQIADRNFTE